MGRDRPPQRRERGGERAELTRRPVFVVHHGQEVRRAREQVAGKGDKHLAPAQIGKEKRGSAENKEQKAERSGRRRDRNSLRRIVVLDHRVQLRLQVA